MDAEECSAIVLGLEARVVQPCFVAPGASGETLKVCPACARTALLPGLASLPRGGNVVPLAPFRCAAAVLPTGSPLLAFGENIYASRLSSGAEVVAERTPARAALELDLYDQAAKQQAQVSMQPATQRSAQEIVARVASLAKQVRAYESESLQAEARQLIPWDAVETYAAEEDAGLGKSPGEYRGRAALAKGLMRWFKKDFFKWTNKPSCPNPSCGRGGPFQEPIGMLAPSTEEREHGWASRVEGYKCKECSTVHRFPRYNNPAVLLQTRKGRCGEWANCFTLICRAAGFEARHVTDWTDHVWTEVWIDDAEPERLDTNVNSSPSSHNLAPAGASSSSGSSSSPRGRWFHADPCENKLDRPRLYERGWHKKLSYVFAAARDHVVDVAPRYTEEYGELLARRDAAPEAWLAMQVARVSADQLRLHSTSEALARALQSTSNSSSGSSGGNGGGGSVLTLPRAALGAAAAAAAAQAEPLEARLAREHQGFRARLFVRSSEDGNGNAAAEEAQGRETGSLEWRTSRGELGQQAAATSSLSSQGSANRGGHRGNTLKNLLSKGGWDSPDFIAAMSSEVLGFSMSGVTPGAAAAEKDGSEGVDSSPVPGSRVSMPLVPWTHSSSPSSSLITRSASLGLLKPPLLRVEITSIGHDDAIPQFYRNDPRNSSKGVSKYSPRCVMINGFACGGGGRGHNLVALCASTGALLVAGVSFDTWGDPTAGDDFKRCLVSLPPHSFIFVTIVDSGERHLGLAAAGALASCLPANLATIAESNADSASVAANDDADASMIPSRRCAWAMAGRIPAHFNPSLASSQGSSSSASFHGGNDTAWAGANWALGPGLGPIAMSLQVSLDPPDAASSSSLSEERQLPSPPAAAPATSVAAPVTTNNDTAAPLLMLAGRGLCCTLADCRLPDRFLPLADQLSPATPEATVVAAVIEAMSTCSGRWIGMSWRPGAPVLLFAASGLPLHQREDDGQVCSSANKSQGWCTYVLSSSISRHVPSAVPSSGEAEGSHATCTTPPPPPPSSSNEEQVSSASLFATLYASAVARGLDAGAAAAAALTELHEAQTNGATREGQSPHEVPAASSPMTGDLGNDKAEAETVETPLSASQLPDAATHSNWQIVRNGSRGGMHGDTEAFEDTLLVVPPSPSSCENGLWEWPIPALARITVWVDPETEYVSGLQCAWRVPCQPHSPPSSSTAQAFVEVTGPAHVSDVAHKQSTLWLAEGESVVRVTARCGALMDRLEVTTSLGRTVGWGGNGGSFCVLFDTNSSSLSPSSTDKPTNVLLGFTGGRGGHLHHLAAVSVCSSSSPSYSSSKPALTPAPPSYHSSLPPARAVRAVYGGHSRLFLRSAVASLASVAASITEPKSGTTPQGGSSSDSVATAEEVASAAAATITVAAVRAAGRYAANLANKGFGSEADARVTSVRASNNFCDSKLGSHPGGLSLLAAAGFARLEWRSTSTATSTPTTTTTAATVASAKDSSGGDLFLSSVCSSALEARALETELAAIARVLE